jgi:small subunit ribosomal protein S4e
MGKITDFIKFDTGNLCMVTEGANLGRIGVVIKRDILALLMWFV